MNFHKFGGILLSFCCMILLLVGFHPTNAYADEKASVWDTLQNPSAVKQTDGGTASEPESAPLASNDSPSGFMLFLQVVFSLGLIIVLIYLLLRFLAKKQVGNSQSGPMRVVSSLSLGSNKSLHLVMIGDSLYILGIGDSVQLIRHIPAGDEMDLLLAEAEIKTQAKTLPDWFPFLRGKKASEIELPFTNQPAADVQSFSELLERQWEEVNQDKRPKANWQDGDNGGGRA